MLPDKYKRLKNDIALRYASVLTLLVLGRHAERRETELLASGRTNEEAQGVAYSSPCVLPAAARPDALLRPSDEPSLVWKRGFEAFAAANPTVAEPFLDTNWLQSAKDLRELVAGRSNDANELAGGPVGETADLLIDAFSDDDDNLLPGADLRRLLVSLLDLRPGVSVIDFAAKSGALLEGVLQAADHEGIPVRVEGQESSGHWRGIATLVAALRGPDRMLVHAGDALFDPLCDSSGRLRRFDRAISIPPFGARDSVARLAGDPFHRFTYGTPHRAAMDLAWLQHALASLQPGGKAVVLLPASAMTRSGTERDIRAALFKDDRIDTLVSLPAGLFPNAPRLETIAVVLHQQKNPARRGRVLLARAKGERRERRLELADVPRLLHLCANWEEVRGVSRVLTLDELSASDFVVSAARHLETTKDAAPVDVAALRTRVRENERIAEHAARELDEHLAHVPGWELEA